jgi:hypothetical protein
MKVRVGETFVLGNDKATVGAMLAAADRAGVSQRKVRMQQDGVIIPNEVADEAFGVAAPSQEPPLAATTPLPETPDEEPTTSAEPETPHPDKANQGQGSTTSAAKKTAPSKKDKSGE